MGFDIIEPMPYKNKEQQREYQRNWMKKRRDAFFKGKECIECGSSEDLQLHHIGKKENHRIWSWSEKRRNEELKQCVVKCKDCHMDEHYEEWRSPCGTDSAYSRGCRCDSCKKAHSEYAADYRRRNHKKYNEYQRKYRNRNK